MGEHGAADAADLDRTQSVLITDAGGAAGDLQFSLVVYSEAGVQVAPLLPRQPLLIGRQPPSDLIIPDASLSRRHAKFELVDDEVWVEDLESTNGTFLNGERMERSRVVPRDEVHLGAVSVALRLTSRAEERARGLETHDLFQALLRYEVTRAVTFGRGVALLMIRAASGDE